MGVPKTDLLHIGDYVDQPDDHRSGLAGKRTMHVTFLPVAYEPDGHDPDVEDGYDEKDDGDDDAVGEDDGMRAGEVVEDGGLRQYSAPVLTLQEILQRVNCKPGGFINKIP